MALVNPDHGNALGIPVGKEVSLMEKFFISRAAYALTLATQRGYSHDMDGLLALGKEVLGKSKPLTSENPDVIVGKALSEFCTYLGYEEEQWRVGQSEASYLRGLISEEKIDVMAMGRAMEILDRTEGPGTPGCAYDAEEDLSLILLWVFLGANLAFGALPHEVAGALSEGRVKPPEAACFSVSKSASVDADSPF